MDEGCVVVVKRIGAMVGNDNGCNVVGLMGGNAEGAGDIVGL